MSHFIFKARKASGEVYKGEKDANDHYELYKILRDQGEEVVEFKEKRSSKGFNVNLSISFFDKVKTIEKINFARNLAAMLEAGLALSRALVIIERQSRSKTFKKVVSNLIQEVDKGVTLSDSMSKQKKVFPQLFIAMVHAGEQSGTLTESLKIVALQMESAYDLDKRVKGAMMYPAVILLTMIIIGILMMIYVVPTLLSTFSELKVKLPPATQLVLNISNLFQHHGLLMLIIIVISFSFLVWWSKKESGRAFIHAFILKIPVIGTLVQEVNTARTARTMSSLLSSGVDIVESINITATVVQNIYFRKVLEKASLAIKNGELMSKTFNQYTKYYPLFFVEMISVGEETGKTGEMLFGVAKYFEDDVNHKTKDMSTIIEPVLILMIGGAVGFFAVAMIQPMYSLVGSV
jgi:type IV pilus assembly protein PilC